MLCLLPIAAIQVSTRILNLQGKLVPAFETESPKGLVAIFILSECPIANRYIEECKRIRKEFINDFDFKIVYSDASPTLGPLQSHASSFGIEGWAFYDRRGELRKLANATVSPQAAVFDARGHLRYSGRIDNLYASLGRRRAKATVHDLLDALAAMKTNKPVMVSRTTAIGCVLPPN